MPGVQTTQILTKASSNERALSKKRVPLRALQMLTQSVATREYVQPIPISEGNEHQKKSPLALLAATCSSIGKTETKQDTSLRETLTPVSRLSPKSTLTNSTPPTDGNQRSKLSIDETKSSFKPYKSDEKEPNQTTEKPGFRAPTKDIVPSDSLNHSSHSKSPDFRTKGHIASFAPFQYPYYADSSSAHCFYQPQNRMCGMYFDLGHQAPPGHHSCLKSDCTGNCSSVLVPPSSIAPPTNATTPSLRAIFPSTPVSAPSTVKSHGLPSSASNRSNPLYPRCNCGYCNQTGPSQEGSNLKGIQHPGLAAAHYHRDYLQTATNCQDPYCTNCKSQILTTPGTSPTSPRGCGPHCFHHHHENTAVLPGSVSAMTPAMSHMYPYGFMLRSQSDQPNQYVCNWVQDSKNCGKNFPTSDELLQHLRTHTSAAANTTTPVHTPCNIPGCPCSLKSSLSSGPSRLHPSRYHPYFIPSAGPLPSPTYHSPISPYVTPHGIPYASPFKPY